MTANKAIHTGGCRQMSKDCDKTLLQVSIHSYKEDANCLSNLTKYFCVPKVERKRKHVFDYFIKCRQKKHELSERA
jgi:hypothetical protein